MLRKNIIIIGAGPAGLFTAYKLINNKNINKNYNVIIIDKGKDIDKRDCPMRYGSKCLHCSPCNILHGFGGSGTFSDCKLSLTPYGVGGDIIDYVDCEKAESLVDEVDSVLASFDNDKEKRKIIGNDIDTIFKLKEKYNIINLDLLYCPTKHLGTDGTYNVMLNLRKYLENMGVTFYFNIEVTNISKMTNDMFYIDSMFYSEQHSFYCSKLIISPGRSGNTWLKNIAKSLHIKTKNHKVDIGVRVETLSIITKELTDLLYDIKLSYIDKLSGNKVRTFCTNPNGYVSEEHYQDNLAIVNGHSFANKKSNNTNFALLVTLNEENLNTEYITNIVKNANILSENKIICQEYDDFIHNKITNESTIIKPTLSYAVFKDFNLILPTQVTNMIKEIMNRLNIICPGIINKGNTLLYGIETKFYSDKIETNNNFETSVKNLYVGGDGAGITRGIIQAASTGLVIAEDIINNLE